MAIRKEGGEGAEINSIISKFKELSKDDKIKLISEFVNALKDMHGVSEHEIFSSMPPIQINALLRKQKEIFIPVGVFGNDTLSSLEAIVKYMKEELKLRFSVIGKLLNRSSKTIWATYHNASRKMPYSFGDVSADIVIPASAIAERSFSTLESIVSFIKEIGYSNHETALMLHLDDRTIWTVYDRIKKKKGVKA